MQVDADDDADMVAVRARAASAAQNIAAGGVSDKPLRRVTGKRTASVAAEAVAEPNVEAVGPDAAVAERLAEVAEPLAEVAVVEAGAALPVVDPAAGVDYRAILANVLDKDKNKRVAREMGLGYTTKTMACRAYHAARKDAKAVGLPEDVCTRRARDAHAAVTKYLDHGHEGEADIE